MWLKKKTTVTSASPTDQQMKGAHQKQIRCLFPTCTHRKSGKPSFRMSPQSFRKVVRPPFNILNYTQKQGGTQTNRRNTLTLKKAHHVQTVTKIRIRQANSFTLFTVTPFLPTHRSPQKSQPVHVEGKASRARFSTLCS